MTNRAHFETRSSSGETLAALLATVLDRGTARSCPHPVAETVTTFATTDFRLVGPLHDISEKVGKRESRTDYESSGPTQIPDTTRYSPTEIIATYQRLPCSRRIQPTREKNIRGSWRHPCRPSPIQNMENANSTRSFPVEETGQPFPQCRFSRS